MDEIEEKEALRRLAEGDDEAFRQIYYRYSGIIFGAARIYVKDFDAARDIVQQVFVEIWEKRALIPTIESFPDHIIRISRNRIMDRFRQISTEARKVPPSFGPADPKRQE